MLYNRQVPNLSQTNLNEIYASQTASVERGGHPDMEFLHSSCNSAFPETYASLSKKPFSSAPRWKSASGCTQLRAFRKQGKNKTWRGAQLNAFDKCEQLDEPQWLRFLPPNANDQWRDDF